MRMHAVPVLVILSLAGAAIAQDDTQDVGDLVPGPLYPNTAETLGVDADLHARIAPLGLLGPVPADNPMTEAKVELGELLFWDPRLSGNASMSCASCHLPEAGWGTGGAISFGHPGTTHWRNSQTILNSAYCNKLFWAGASPSLEAQAPAAAHGAVAGNGDDSIMERRLAFIPDYVARFDAVFGTRHPVIGDAWKAIAAYQRTIVSDPAAVPFDRFAGDDEAALSDAARRGLDLFRGEVGCITCHGGPLAPNQQYYATGLPREITTETRTRCR